MSSEVPVPPLSESETVNVAPQAAPAEAHTLAPAAPLPENGSPVPGPVPGYEILGELGRGGMGVVYKARQLAAARVVALKMILSGGHAGEADLARFRTEAQAVARLQHPGIVQVFEVAEHQGLPFFSLEFVGGGSLDKKLKGTPLPPMQAARLVEQVAQAMHAAHAAQVIHRDLKPANILLTAEGQPKVTDFGLAKALDVEQGHTATGSIMGTPSYMAPEQAGGQTRDIGPAADVYALGAVLYECLTGRPPFKAATALDTLLQALSHEPVPPRQLNAKVPRDLETICLKCLRKEPPRRYATAAELADDLGRFQRGEAILARPVGRMERAAKWVKRNPVVTALAALVVLSLLGGASGIFVKYLDAKEQEGIAKDQTGIAREQEGIARRKAKEAEDALSDRDAALKQARDDKALAEAREREANYQLATSNVLLAQAAWDSNNAAAARERLAAVPADLRRWEWYYLKRQYQGGIFTLNAQAILTSVAFSPDGTRLATAGLDGTARLWDARTGRSLLECKGHTSPVGGVAFSPDGRRLATASDDRTARLWDTQTGEQLLVCEGHTNAVLSVAFSHDGTRLATASSDKTARLWDARTGKQVQICKGHTDVVASVAYSPDGTRLATASSDKTARLWDARTGQYILECKDHVSGLQSVAFSPDGTRLATAGNDLTVRLWDALTGKPLLACRGGGFVFSMTFSPDGTRLATASYDRMARLWDARTGQQLLECKGHTDRVTSVAFSPDGTRLATASYDGTARLWDARTGQPFLECKGHVSWLQSVAFSPDGTRLATASDDRTARLWDARTGQFLREFKGHTGPVRGVAFSPDGTRLATASQDRTVRLWDVQTGKQLLVCEGHAGPVFNVAFSPDGTQLVTASFDKTARLWDARTGRFLQEFKGHTLWARGVAFSPDGKRLATASEDRTARLWNAQTGEQLLVCKGHNNGVASVVFSPDGTRLATASDDRTARLWDARTGQPLVQCKGHSQAVVSAMFSPDGTRLATASHDDTARLWDARTGQPLLECKGHTGFVTGVAFSPEGTWLATASYDKTARLWDARPVPLPPGEELAYRLWATRGESDWHAEQFAKLQNTDRFAAAFHLDRLLASRPAQRSALLHQRTAILEATLMQDTKNAAARLLLARTAWHSPTLGPKDAATLLPSADKNPIAQRTRGALLLRLQKADEAITVLETALQERGDGRPPVEELLLAWAYSETRQTDKAKGLWTKATAWLDRGQEAARAANVVGALPGGVLPGVAMLFAPPTDPRSNAFDWETWHELDVLRRELTPRFAAK